MIEFSQDTTLPLGDIMLKEMKYFFYILFLVFRRAITQKRTRYAR